MSRRKRLERTIYNKILMIVYVILIIVVLYFFDLEDYINAPLTVKISYWIFGTLIIVCFFVQMMRILIPVYKHWKYRRSPLSRLDHMDPYEFEYYAAWLLSQMGYKKCSVTVKSNDYGADVICKHKGKKAVMQVKRYRGKVGISAVQQVVAAKAYYNAEEAIIFTNSLLTPSAINLAKANKVRIIDRNELLDFGVKRAEKKEVQH